MTKLRRRGFLVVSDVRHKCPFFQSLLEMGMTYVVPHHTKLSMLHHKEGAMWTIHPHPQPAGPLTTCCMPPGSFFSSGAPVQAGLLWQPAILMRRQYGDSPDAADEWSAPRGGRERQPELLHRLEHFQRRRTRAECNRWGVGLPICGGGGEDPHSTYGVLLAASCIMA